VPCRRHQRGWQVKPTNPARRTLADALATLRRLDQDDYFQLLEAYAETAERLAADEIETVARRGDLDSVAEAVVVWTAIGDTVFASLHRLAQEDRSTRLLGSS
jgi:hypothetical protein